MSLSTPTSRAPLTRWACACGAEGTEFELLNGEPDPSSLARAEFAAHVREFTPDKQAAHQMMLCTRYTVSPKVDFTPSREYRERVRGLQQRLDDLTHEFVATDCPPLDEESVRAFADFLETHLPVDSGSVSRLPR